MADIVEFVKPELTLHERRNLLTYRERLAYDAMVTSHAARPPIAASTAVGMFQSFLAGKECDEIAKISGAFTLAEVVRTRVEDRWDERRKDYRESLLKGAQDSVRQEVLASTYFVLDQLAATRKYHGERIAKYLQTGEQEYISSLFIFNPKSMKEMVDVLMTLTGQNKPKNGQIDHTGTVTHEVKAASDGTPGLDTNLVDVIKKKGLTPEQAAVVMKALSGIPEDQR